MANDFWSAEDERYFFERYAALSEAEKPAYLVRNAFLMFVYGKYSDYDKVLWLTEKFFEEFPEENEIYTVALFLCGKVRYARKEFEEAFECYKKAVDTELRLNIAGIAWAAYAEYIIKFDKTELFDEALKIISVNYDKQSDLPDIYRANAMFAYLAGKKGDQEKAAYYQKHADGALNEMTALRKSVRYTRVIRDWDKTHDLSEKIKSFILEKGFTLVDTDDGVRIWRRRGFLCLNNLTAVHIFDVVIIIAYISFTDLATGLGQEAGLNGFIAGFGKWPFKATVKRLERLVKANQE